MAFQETTWLDRIPGARTAYNFLMSKAAEFYLIGTKKIPGWEAQLTRLQPRIEQKGDAALKKQLTDVTRRTVDLKSAWASLETRVTQMLDRLRGVGLGDGEGLGLPVAIPVALAVGLITLVGGLYIFFGSTARHEKSIRDLCNTAVAKGVLSIRECAGILREGGGDPLGLGKMSGGLAIVALAAAAIWFLPRKRSA